MVFKTTAIDHSAIPPHRKSGQNSRILVACATTQVNVSRPLGHPPAFAHVKHERVTVDKPAFASVHHLAFFGVAVQSAKRREGRGIESLARICASLTIMRRIDSIGRASDARHSTTPSVDPVGIRQSAGLSVSDRRIQRVLERS